MNISLFRLPEKKRLSLLYQNLSEYLEAVGIVAHVCGQTDGRAMAVVLEEDLSSLCEECEEYLVCGVEDDSKVLHSFEARSFTVIDEVHHLMKHHIPLGPPRTKQIRKRKSIN